MKPYHHCPPPPPPPPPPSLFTLVQNMAVVFMLTVITSMGNLTITVCSKNISLPFLSNIHSGNTMGQDQERVLKDYDGEGGMLQGMIQPG